MPRHVGELESLLERLEAIPDMPSRDVALAAVQALVEFYGAGLARIVGHVAHADDASLTAALVGDELVSHLLMLHDLHPEPLEARVRRALESVRPYLRSHGGNVELIAVEDGVARVQLEGSCHGCPSSAVTLRTAVETAVRAAAPELVDIDAGEATLPNVPSPVFVELGRARRGVPDVPHASTHTSPDGEHCELCGAPVSGEHRHVLDLSQRRLLCACRACATLFDESAAGGRHYRLVPDRWWRLDDFALSDARWATFRIPVDMAFFFFNSAAGRVVTLYPSPVGATESLLELTAWDELCAENPVLTGLAPDVEALLVNRTRGAREYWLLPVDACYTLVGLIRTHWKGLNGGDEVWNAISHYFDELRARAVVVRRGGNTVGGDSDVLPQSPPHSITTLHERILP